MKTKASPEDALRELGVQYRVARVDAEMARENLAKAVRSHLAAGATEVHVAAVAGVDRTTVRKWRRQHG